MQHSTALAPVAATASRIESNTGTPATVGAALARRDAADDRRSARDHALREEPPGLAGDALHQDL